MSDVKNALYEGLFLVNPQAMAGDLAGALETIRGMLDRAEAEVVSLRKWDERKLAYPVEGQKRGLYVIAYFRVRPVQTANIASDCNLSQLVLRVLMTRADHMGEVEINQELEDAQAAADEAKLKADHQAAQAEPEPEASGDDDSNEDAEETEEATAEA